MPKLILGPNPAWKIKVFFWMDSKSLASQQCISGGKQECILELTEKCNKIVEHPPLKCVLDIGRLTIYIYWYLSL